MRPEALRLKIAQRTEGLALSRRHVRPREAASLAALAVLASLTEGLGLILMVPILRLVEAGGSGLARGDDPASRLWHMLDTPPRLVPLLIAFVVLIGLRSLLVQARILGAMALEARAVRRMRTELFATLLDANWRYLSAMRGGEALSAVLSLVERMGMALQSLFALGAALITLVAAGIGALLIAPAPALALAAGGLTVLAAYAGMRRRAGRHGMHLDQATRAFFAFFTERLAAVRIIKSHDREAAEVAAGRRVNRALDAARIGYQRSFALGQIALETTAGIALATSVWWAVTHWQAASFTLLPVIALFARCLPLLQAAQGSWQNWAHARPALRELADLLDKARAGREPGGNGTDVPEPCTAIVLDNITVRHPGRANPALSRVTLRLAKGSTTMLSGPSGAGKSTLADLVAGMIWPDEGEVRIDDQPLNHWGLASWRRRVAYVQQDPVLFDGTIRDNLLWAAPDADEVSLHHALAAASAGFVWQLPDGLDTVVGERGNRLSGGERQRIALARGLLRRPSVLILDEVTSALDRDNQTAIAAAVAGLKGSLTIVIVAHDGALAHLADRVVRIEAGRIVTQCDTVAA